MVIFRRSDLDRELRHTGAGNAAVPQGESFCVPSIVSGLIICVDGNRQLITVVDCICADGTVLPPLIIMKGKRPSYGWVKDSELEEGWIAASPNGWTDNELGLKWMEHVFDASTREK